MNTDKAPPTKILLLMGATATGKTQLAFDLFDSQTLPIQIINVDSVQFYRGFNIGSAKPDATDIAHYQLRMVDICNADEIYTVARFCQDIEHEIILAQKQYKIPLLTGGTMMYFRALMQGLSTMPVADPELRQVLRQQGQQRGMPWLHKQLAQIDPATADRLSVNDSQRIIRAIEVFKLSGIPISQWHQQTTVSKHQYLPFAVSRFSRSELHRRIESRFQNMLTQGLVDEVSTLRKQWHQHLSKPVFRSIGYKQVLDYIHGVHDYTMMIAKATTATKQLAKRQTTWLRNWPDVHHLNNDNNQALVQEIATIVDGFTLSGTNS